MLTDWEIVMEIFKKHFSGKNVIFFVIMILFLVFLCRIKDIAILFFASYVISCSLNPLVDKLSKKTGRGLASSIVLVGSLLILTLFLVPIIVTGGQQIKSFLSVLPEHFNTFKSFILGLPFLASSNISQMDLGDIVSSASGVTTDFVTKSINFSKDIASAFVYFLAACIIIYYFMADRNTINKAYLSLFPESLKERAQNIIESISQKIGGYLVAQLATMTTVGLIVMFGLMILRIDYALILGLITGLFDIVPVVGPAVAFIIIMLTVFKSGPLTVGLVILVFVFAQWAENNLVRPYIFSKFLNIHPLIIYFFLFLTAQYLGFIGVVFAPAIAATVCVLIEELYIKSINE